MKRRAIVSLLFGLLVYGIGMAQDTIPDVTANHWVFEGLQRLKKDGLMVGYPDGLWSNRHHTRYEIAILAHACYTNVQLLASDLAKQARRPGLMPVGSEADQAYRDAEADAKGLKQGISSWKVILTNLIKEVRPELSKLGVDPIGMQKHLLSVCSGISQCQVSKPGSALVQFVDVPSTHWAAKQILELRRLGILEGYASTSSAPNRFN